MSAKIFEIEGKRYAIMSERAYKSLTRRARVRSLTPQLPVPDADGNVPALEYGRASLARKVIAARRAAGLTQVELARRARIRPETLNRIERGKTTPDVATLNKIRRVLQAE